MKKPRAQPAIFTSPADVARALFAALEACNIEAMMALWAEDEEITCTHPGGSRVSGYPAVREAWSQIFMGNTGLVFRPDDIVAVETVGLASHSAHVWIYAQSGELRGIAAVTLVFMRTPIGWRLVSYHASLVPQTTESPSGGIVH